MFSFYQFVFRSRSFAITFMALRHDRRGVKDLKSLYVV